MEMLLNDHRIVTFPLLASKSHKLILKRFLARFGNFLVHLPLNIVDPRRNDLGFLFHLSLFCDGFPPALLLLLSFPWWWLWAAPWTININRSFLSLRGGYFSKIAVVLLLVQQGESLAVPALDLGLVLAVEVLGVPLREQGRIARLETVLILELLEDKGS